MTIGEALKWGIKKLTGSGVDPVRGRSPQGDRSTAFGGAASNGVDSPALDAEVILAHVLGVPRAELYIHPLTTLLPAEAATYKILIKRRFKREPVAYITGHKEFYGMDFIVDKSTLIPRPETEMLVEEALKAVKARNTKTLCVVDVGTGSGCIIVSLTKILNQISRHKTLHFFATEISPQALKIAKLNAKRHSLADKIVFRKGYLLKPILSNLEKTVPQSRLLITANLPYLPTAEWRRAMEDVHYEPRQALDGGKDGLEYYRHLFEQLKSWRGIKKFANVAVLAEIDPHQVNEFTTLIKSFFSRASYQSKKIWPALIELRSRYYESQEALFVVDICSGVLYCR
ncbi:MAG: Release factor glutamine methyltransferase [Parcubacteria group bacterium GW2011_GWC2_45_7]|nr:MAG: Release factor glutamine methyltransferase [Parcubacteria group bacterium GW2011_GWC2_45_7]